MSQPTDAKTANTVVKATATVTKTVPVGITYRQLTKDDGGGLLQRAHRWLCQ